MLRVKGALKGLQKRWIFSLLLLIQITYGLSTITGSTNVFYNLYYLGHHSVLDLNSTYLIVPKKSTGKMIEENSGKEKIEEIYNRLAHHQDVIAYGTYEEQFITLDSSSRPLNSKMTAELTNTHLPIGKPSINGIMIDENYNQLLDLHITEGRGFSGQDFKKNRDDKTSVLVGSYFKSYFQIGDEINHQYTIIGFLPDKYIVNSNTSNIYQKLGKAMLIPMSEDIANDPGSMVIRINNGAILKLREGADLDQLNQIIQLPDNDPLILKNLGDDVRHNISSNAYLELPQLILGAAFILFSVTGIIVTTIVSIMIRKREFGIKLVLGESIHGIFRQIMMENAAIGIMGMGISLIHFKWKFNGLMGYSSDFDLASPLDFKLNVSILFVIFLILVLIMVLSNFIVFGFIRRLEPKALIGGME